MARIEMYTTAFCPFCVRAKRLLQERGLAYEEFDVADDAALRDDVIKRSGRRTVPQIFINGRSVGGFDDLSALVRRGELPALLAAPPVADPAPPPES